MHKTIDSSWVMDGVHCTRPITLRLYFLVIPLCHFFLSDQYQYRSFRIMSESFWALSESWLNISEYVHSWTFLNHISESCLKISESCLNISESFLKISESCLNTSELGSLKNGWKYLNYGWNCPKSSNDSEMSSIW